MPQRMLNKKTGSSSLSQRLHKTRLPLIKQNQVGHRTFCTKSQFCFKNREIFLSAPGSRSRIPKYQYQYHENLSVSEHEKYNVCGKIRCEGGLNREGNHCLNNLMEKGRRGGGKGTLAFFISFFSFLFFLILK